MRKVLVLLIIALVLVQFVRPERNESGVRPADIASIYPVPADVNVILEKACNDCHSNKTRYPWYTNIQPIGLWMQNHVNEGKRELNFNEFASYSAKRQMRKLDKVIGMVEKNEMPLPSYTWIHKDAILTDAEKNTLIYWAKGLQQQIKPALQQQ
ncbi:MAG: heme-binding domain-containing protein [Bacteroidetes bacterium]|nr:heme-binding domain-containing protein [Bacteroidota bacterium]